MLVTGTDQKLGHTDSRGWMETSLQHAMSRVTVNRVVILCSPAIIVMQNPGLKLAKEAKIMVPG